MAIERVKSRRKQGKGSQNQVTTSEATTTRSFKIEPNRQSSWTRHLNQSKSIRLRPVVIPKATTTTTTSSSSSGGGSAGGSGGCYLVRSANLLAHKRKSMSECKSHCHYVDEVTRQHHKDDAWDDEASLVSIIINQNNDVDVHEQQTAAAAAAAAARAMHETETSNTSDKLKNQNHTPHRNHHHNHNHHCQMISSTTMKPKLTRHNKSDCGRPAVKTLERGRRRGSCSSATCKPPLAHKSPGSLLLPLMVAAICLAFALLIDLCNCDSVSTSHSNSGGSLLGNVEGRGNGGARSNAWSFVPAHKWPGIAMSSRDGNLQPAARRYDSQPKTTTTSGALPLDSAHLISPRSSNSGHKEKLLSSLSESIERQHWGLAGSSAKSRSPSNIQTTDSGASDDYFKDIIAKHEGKLRQHSTMTTSKPSSLASPPSKAEQGLRQIMMMHESSVAAAGMTNKHASHHQEDGKSTQQYGGGGGSSSSISSGGPIANTARKTTRWLVTAAGESPLKLLAPKGADRLVSGFMSLMPPMRSSGASGDMKQALVPGGGGGDRTASTDNSTMNHFTPRANAKNYLMSPLLGLGQMLMHTARQPSSSKPSLTNPFYYQTETATPITDQSVYSKPANSFRGASPFLGTKKTATNTGSKTKKQLQGSQLSDTHGDLLANESSPSHQTATSNTGGGYESPVNNKTTTSGPPVSKWIKNGANQLAQSYFQDSFRDLLTLSQLPILSGGPVSTAPSDLEPGGKKWLVNKMAAQQNRFNRTQMIEDLIRYAYILGNVGVRRKRDPLKVLASSPPTNTALALASHNTLHHSHGDKWLAPFKALSILNSNGLAGKLPTRKLSSFLSPDRNIKPRGVMWDMATDPTLAVTVFHLLERASVALPLGFLLMPFVRMIRHPLNGMNLGRIIPARASHRSVDYEELVKRIDMMDKILSRAMRPTHRGASFMG